MAVIQTLTAAPLTVDGKGTDLTSLLSAPTSGTTALQFQNTLNTILLVGTTAGVADGHREGVVPG